MSKLINKYHIVFISIIFSIMCNAQVDKSNALLLSLNGSGNYKRAGVESELSLPQSYKPGDVISVSSGSVTIMLFSGDEIIVKPAEQYTVPEYALPDDSELLAMANSDNSELNLLSQSSSAFKIRGQRHIYPSQSKVTGGETIKLFVKLEKKIDYAVNVLLIDEFSQKIVWQASAVKDSIILIDTKDIAAGKSYYWSVTGLGPLPEMGTIQMLSAKEKAELKTDLKHENLLNYMDNISYYYAKALRYKALDEISQAKLKYPDANILDFFYQKIILE